MPFDPERKLLLRSNIAGENKTYLFSQVPDINQLCIFSTEFKKKTLKSNFNKLRPVGAALIGVHADRRTNTTKVIHIFVCLSEYS